MKPITIQHFHGALLASSDDPDSPMRGWVGVSHNLIRRPYDGSWFTRTTARRAVRALRARNLVRVWLKPLHLRARADRLDCRGLPWIVEKKAPWVSCSRRLADAAAPLTLKIPARPVMFAARDYRQLRLLQEK